MPRVEEFHLHSFGWENDPEEERFKLSTLDYLSTITYTNTALFFKVEDAEKTQLAYPSDSKAAAILKQGLERTLSQVRHLVGTIERDQDGHHSIVRKKNSTVKFVVQHLDTPDDKFPSLDDIADAHFLSTVLGDINVLSVAPMTCGNKPEAHPDNSPAVSSFKANFIRGGLILNLLLHHYSNGITGFTSFVRQLAENCYAIAHTTEFPSFDPKCLDRSLFGSLGFDRPSSTSKETQVDAPPRADRNLQHRPSQSLVFHLRKSRAVELKKAAAPGDGSWISTYNAICALMWRVLTRIREPLYRPGFAYMPIWASGVSISKLFTDPPIPEGMQGNLQLDITSTMSPVPQLSLAEIISEAPLSQLASYTRQVTDGVTADMLAAALQKVARVRNKQDLSIHLDSFPPMAILVSDWRHANLCTFDFGFAEPVAFRHLFGGVPLCQALVYPARKGPAADDEGMEVQVTFETELMEQLVNDPEWSKYFEFRGVDASEEESSSDGNPRSKL
ncbi:transferase [Dactylonectria macrodidyma]|uniref:Transferase n=1 Tax=Dactylonectria macrodidyma TaxID=307937 RepID=A0A9P9IFB6_9HYPO|nr:transferase [Dactylonectria macrodidyma]